MTFYIPSIDNETLKSVIPRANKMDFGIELFDFVNPLIFNNNLENYVKDLKEILVPYSHIEGNLSAHAPFYDLNPLSIDSDIKSITLKKYHQMLDAAIALGIKKVVFHTPYTPIVKLAFYENYFIESSIKFWKEQLKPFEDSGITVLLENTYEPTPDILKNIIAGVNSDKLRACLDIGHVNINSKKTVVDWIKSLGENLVYMHLHNNDGIYDTHDSVLNGTLDFKRIYSVLKELNLAPDMSFEIFNEANKEESIKFVTDLVHH